MAQIYIFNNKWQENRNRLSLLQHLQIPEAEAALEAKANCHFNLLIKICIFAMLAISLGMEFYHKAQMPTGGTVQCTGTTRLEKIPKHRRSPQLQTY